MEPYIKGRELLLEGSQEKNQKKNSIFPTNDSMIF